jgi:hypothetical protein
VVKSSSRRELRRDRQDRLDAGRLEAGVGDHRAEGFHAREAADRFDEVAVALLVAGNDFADARNDGVGITVVKLAEAGPFAGREFEAVEAPPRLRTRCASRSAAGMS